MGYAIGTVTKGAGDDCHYQVLDIIKTLAEANGWTTQRYVNTGLDREWIGKSLGLSGTEEIFIGVKTYQSVAGDYYNFLLGGFTGYLAANSFETQPGAKLSGLPAHNNAITYYLSMNAQRLALMLKVGTPVYTHGYLGKLFPYARPSEYPNPLVCAGSFDGAELKRFSDTNQVFPYHGDTISSYTNFYLRSLNGDWYQPAMYPFSHGASTTGQYSTYAIAGDVSYNCQVPANDFYQVEPIIIHDRISSSNLNQLNNLYGELDGVYFVSGFNNAAENVVQSGGSSVVDQTGLTVLQAVDAIIAVGGRAFVMGQNINRTSWRDFVAIEMS